MKGDNRHEIRIVTMSLRVRLWRAKQSPTRNSQLVTLNWVGAEKVVENKIDKMCSYDIIITNANRH